MDSDEELLQFSEPEDQRSPVPQRKLKRLRKATDKVSEDLPIPSRGDVPSTNEVYLPLDRGESDKERFEESIPRFGSELEVSEEEFGVDSVLRYGESSPGAKKHFSPEAEVLDRGESDKEQFEESIPRFRSHLEVSEEGFGLNSFLRNGESSPGANKHLEFDSLDEEFGGGGSSSGSKKRLEFDSLDEDFDGKGGDGFGTEVEEEIEHPKMNLVSEKQRGYLDGLEMIDEDESSSEAEEESGDSRMNGKAEKKRRNSAGFEEKGEKKRKKKIKHGNDGFDDSIYSAPSTKKERRERLQKLRAESQRLLRETRDASFRPVPLVQKSVSSVLEKIRQRKRELSKKLVNMTEDTYSDCNNAVSRAVDFDFLVEDKEDHKDAEGISVEITSTPVVEASVEAQGEQGSKETSNASDDNVTASVEAQGEQGSKDTSNASDDNVTSKMVTDDDFKQTFRAPVEDTQDLIFDSPESHPTYEIPRSSLEDILAPSLTAMNLKLDSGPPDDIFDEEAKHKTFDPAKAFLDDEAEEEDDSDGDRARFPDVENEDDMDSEELNDMIATTYEEKPIDNEMRNQLHQKWLEQQDAVGTENLLQRLKGPSKQREMAFAEESEDEEESEEGSDIDPTEGILPRDAVRLNLKKAKEMIPLMFTDKDDVYVSSDDEETENTLVRRRFSHKAEEQSKFLSPAEDESSKGIFGLIKKVNDAPDAKKKGRISPNLNVTSLGGNGTLPLKSSFISRGSRNSLPSLQKHNSSTVRSYIFERDESNSRSAILTAEDSSDTVPEENRPKKAATAKFSYSQVRSSSQTTESRVETKSGPSLHEILRCPSIRSSDHIGGSMAGQVEAIYAAFKLERYSIKKEPGLSLRTV